MEEMHGIQADSIAMSVILESTPGIWREHLLSLGSARRALDRIRVKFLDSDTGNINTIWRLAAGESSNPGGRNHRSVYHEEKVAPSNL